MSRLTYPDWKCYAVLRSAWGKSVAEEYRHMRNAQHRERGTGIHPTQSDWTLVNAEPAEDGYIKKQLLPYHMTEFEKLTYKNALWMYVYSPWDCTGQRFTRDISFHEVPQGTWVYHFIGIDI